MKWLFILLLSLCSPVFASTITPQVSVLDNGLTVIVYPMKQSATVSINAFVKAGSTYENQCLGCGMSHYVEHMLFKGTKRRKTGDIPREVKGLGGVINAHTSFDETVYTLDLPSASWDKGLDIISDMLTNATFDEQEMERERKVIYGEMRLYEDNPSRKLSQNVFKQAYIYHPYKDPVIGYRSLFDKVDRQMLYNYYKTFYVPNNIIISVAGNVDGQQVLEWVKNFFKDILSKPLPSRLVSNEPDISFPRYNYQFYPGSSYHVSYAFKSVSLLSNDLYALDVLSSVLGDGQSSLLYQELYKKEHWVEGVSASNYTPLDPGLFEIEMIMSKDHIQESVKRIEEVLEEIQNHGISADQLQRVKKQIQVRYDLSSVRSSQFADRFAQDYAYTRQVNFSAHYVEGIKQVRNEDIKRVAQKYLNRQQKVLTILSPHQEDISSASSLQNISDEPKSIVLPNGLRVFLVQNPLVNVFNLSFAFRAGVREENTENNGITRFFVSNWPYSTTRQPDMALMTMLEKEGISLSVSHTKNSVTLSMDGSSGDVDKAIDAFSQLVSPLRFLPNVMKDKKEDQIQSIKQRQDDIVSAVFVALFSHFFKDHPYAFDSIGSQKNIKSFTIQDLNAYQDKYLRPRNAVLVISGQFDPVLIETILRAKLSSWKDKPVQLDATHYNPQPAGQFVHPIKKEQAMVAWAFRAVPFNNQDQYVFEVIDSLLGSGLGGRLFTKVREQMGQAYTLGADYIPGIDAGVFTIHVLTNYDKVNEVKDLVNKEISGLIDNPITESELADIKNSLIAQQNMSLDTPRALANRMLFDELYGLGATSYKNYAERINQVTLADVNRVIKSYLRVQDEIFVETKPLKDVLNEVKQ